MNSRRVAATPMYSLGRAPAPGEPGAESGSIFQPKAVDLGGGGVLTTAVATLTRGLGSTGAAQLPEGVTGRDLIPPQLPVGVDLISGVHVGSLPGGGLPDPTGRYGVPFPSAEPSEPPVVPWGGGRGGRPGEVWSHYTRDKHRVPVGDFVGSILGERERNRDNNAVIDALVQSKTIPGSDPGSRFGKKRRRPAFDVRGKELTDAERRRQIVGLGLSKDPNRANALRGGPHAEWVEHTSGESEAERLHRRLTGSAPTTGGVGTGGVVLAPGNPGGAVGKLYWDPYLKAVGDLQQEIGDASKQAVATNDATLAAGVVSAMDALKQAQQSPGSPESTAQLRHALAHLRALKLPGPDDDSGGGGGPRSNPSVGALAVAFVDPFGDGSGGNPRTRYFMPAPDDNGPGNPWLYPDPDSDGVGGPRG